MKAVSLLSLVRSHRRLLYMLGTCIVLATFVAKEVLREGSKEKLVRLEDADKSLAEAGERASTVRQMIASTRDDGSDGAIDALGKPVPDRVTERALWRNVRRTTSVDLNAAVDELEVFSRTVPHDDKLDKKEAVLRVELSQLSSTWQALSQSFSGVEGMSRSRLATKQQRDLVLGYETAYEGVADEAEDYEVLVEDKTSIEIINERERLDRYTKISYAMFFVGAVVGLVGKLAEPATEGAEVEA